MTEISKESMEEPLFVTEDTFLYTRTRRVWVNADAKLVYQVCLDYLKENEIPLLMWDQSQDTNESFQTLLKGLQNRESKSVIQVLNFLIAKAIEVEAYPLSEDKLHFSILNA